VLKLSAFLSLRRGCLLGLKWPSSQGFSTSRIVVTIGYGPDFAVLRSKAVKMNISQMVKELMEEIPNGDVSGGVGSGIDQVSDEHKTYT
jgi:RecJ-like exonuclease